MNESLLLTTNYSIDNTAPNAVTQIGSKLCGDLMAYWNSRIGLPFKGDARNSLF